TIEIRNARSNSVAAEKLRVDSVQAHRIASSHRGIDFGGRMDEIEHAAGAVHHVEVELARKPFPKLQRELVEMRIRIEVVVRADDRRVAARVAAPKPALLKHGDVADAMLLREVVRRRETVASATDNDRVVLLFRRRTAPCA